jgi:hypothetical protein
MAVDWQESDVKFLHAFLDKITEEERGNLKFNLDNGIGLATPDHAVPFDGWG